MKWWTVKVRKGVTEVWSVPATTASGAADNFDDGDRQLAEGDPVFHILVVEPDMAKTAQEAEKAAKMARREQDLLLDGEEIDDRIRELRALRFEKRRLEVGTPTDS